MDERRSGDDRRIYPRYSMDRGVEICDGDRRRGGRLQDISAGGAAIQTNGDGNYDEDAVQEGSQIDIDVEDLGFYGAEVIRDLEDGYAVRFDIYDAERDELVSEIMQHGIALDD